MAKKKPEKRLGADAASGDKAKTPSGVKTEAPSGDQVAARIGVTEIDFLDEKFADPPAEAAGGIFAPSLAHPWSMQPVCDEAVTGEFKGAYWNYVIANGRLVNAFLRPPDGG